MAKKTPRDKTWDAFSLYYRAKKADTNGMLKCYTCDTMLRWKGDRMQAGHLLDGRYNSILFDEDGIRPQCFSCNVGRHGNKEIYIPKFIDEMGRGFYDELCRRKWTTVQYKKRDYEEMKEDWMRAAKEIIAKKGLIL